MCHDFKQLYKCRTSIISSFVKNSHNEGIIYSSNIFNVVIQLLKKWVWKRPKPTWKVIRAVIKLEKSFSYKGKEKIRTHTTPWVVVLVFPWTCGPFVVEQYGCNDLVDMQPEKEFSHSHISVKQLSNRSANYKVLFVPDKMFSFKTTMPLQNCFY